MKRVVMILLGLLCSMSTTLYAGNGDFTVSGSMGVGTTTPVASAAVDVTSTTKGFLPPRMTTAQRDAIASPLAGLLIYNTSDNAYNYYTGSSWLVLGDREPAGAVKAYAGQSVPAGWLECNGQAVSRTAYANLFTAIGESFGVGDGTSTFNLPDLRGEFIRGWDHGRGVDAGRTLGNLQAQSTQLHKHQIALSYLGNGLEFDRVGAYGVGPDTFTSSWHTGEFNTTRTWNASLTSDLVSTTLSGDSRPRNIALMYIVKY